MAPDQVLVPLVGRVDGDGRVAEHRLRPHRGHHQLAVAAGERVGDPHQLVDLLPVLHLQVRDRRAEARVPVDHVAVPVDVALLVQRHEYPHHGVGVVLVEREALVVVVA